MDKIGSANTEYKNISKITISIFAFLLEVYILVVINCVDIFNFNMVKDIFLRIVLQVVVHSLVFSSSYIVIYKIVEFIYIKHWIRCNKNIWIKGIWLHIHVKDEIRIGTVKFKQNFHDIEADGHNIYPDGLDYDTWRETK